MLRPTHAYRIGMNYQQWIELHRVNAADVDAPRHHGVDDASCRQVLSPRSHVTVAGSEVGLVGIRVVEPVPRHAHVPCLETGVGSAARSTGRVVADGIAVGRSQLSRSDCTRTRPDRIGRNCRWPAIGLAAVSGRIPHRCESRVRAPLMTMPHRCRHIPEVDLSIAESTNAPAALVADGLSVSTPRGVPLLHEVGFSVPEGSLLAIVGPSGAGKSTLLRALIGTRPADRGSVTCAGLTLSENYDVLRRNIAFVPQDDTLHAGLTVRQTLDYAARLRLPRTLPAADRAARIDQVLADLGLTAQVDQRVDTLSGGQRKRTSLAVELLTEPSLLFLDEPTSGLDPGLDRSIMRELRGIADEQRTVVVVTHNVANLHLCDRVLVLAPGGWVAFYGSPRRALEHFGQPDFAAVFEILPTRPGHEWTDLFRAGHSGDDDPVPPAPDFAPGDPRRPVGRHRLNLPVRSTVQDLHPSSWTQFRLQCRRYASVIAADHRYIAMLTLLPLALSLLGRTVPGSSGFSVEVATTLAAEPQPRLLLMVLILGAALMGSSASLRELVKERPIYLRERAVGLSAGAYFAAKVCILTVISIVQSLIFVVLVTIGHDQVDQTLLFGLSLVEIAIPVVIVTIASMFLGLLISAAIENADRAMPPLVLLVMAQLVATGGMFGIGGRAVIDPLSWLMPARWAFAMTASTTDLSRISRGAVDGLWNHGVGTWLFDAAALIALCLAYATAARLLIRRLEPRQPGASRRRPAVDGLRTATDVRHLGSATAEHHGRDTSPRSLPTVA